MKTSKDYYFILGILQSAEVGVIKAAYKAMLQVYHPDKFMGKKEGAHARTLDINEAYRVLSNKISRAEYDQFINKRSDDSFTYEGDSSSSTEQQKSASNTLDKDWALATKYKPELRLLEQQLSKISIRLAFTFRVEMLEFKKFNSSEQIAKELEACYFSQYFGNKSEVINFAKQLIIDDHKEATHELNQAVKVLGNDLNATKLIQSIKLEFKLYEESEREKFKREQAQRVIAQRKRGVEIQRAQFLKLQRAHEQEQRALFLKLQRIHKQEQRVKVQREREREIERAQKLKLKRDNEKAQLNKYQAEKEKGKEKEKLYEVSLLNKRPCNKICVTAYY